MLRWLPPGPLALLRATPIFIIYNLPGLLLGIAGVVVGLLAMILTGSLGLGMLALAVVWFATGFWWRNYDTASGQKRPFPAVFFIPLPFLAIPLAVLALPTFFVERNIRNRPPDARAELFGADEKMLDIAQATGNASLSQSLLTTLQDRVIEGAKADRYCIFTRLKPDAVLVLMKAPNLKDYSDNARRQLIETIMEILQADEQSKGKRLYVGIKGRINFGAIRVPPDVVKIDGFVGESPLYEFYDDTPTLPTERGSDGQTAPGSRAKSAAQSSSAHPLASGIHRG